MEQTSGILPTSKLASIIKVYKNFKKKKMKG